MGKVFSLTGRVFDDNNKTERQIMNDTPTPRTDLLTTKHWGDGFAAHHLKPEMQAMERELTAAREELIESQKDYKCLAELLDGHDATECRMNLVRLKEQRDRLAAVLQDIRDGYGGQVADPNCDCGDCAFLIPIDEALQSLDQPKP